MYVIATVICPNFHFSVSPHVPFLNLLFEQIANSNEYLFAKFGLTGGTDTALLEPATRQQIAMAKEILGVRHSADNVGVLLELGWTDV